MTPREGSDAGATNVGLRPTSRRRVKPVLCPSRSAAETPATAPVEVAQPARVAAEAEARDGDDARAASTRKTDRNS